MKQIYNYSELFNFFKKKVGHDCSRIILYDVFNYELIHYIDKIKIEKRYDYINTYYITLIDSVMMRCEREYREFHESFDSPGRYHQYAPQNCKGCNYLERKKSFFNRITRFIFNNKLIGVREVGYTKDTRGFSIFNFHDFIKRNIIKLII
jgi:hypothetical protein